MLLYKKGFWCKTCRVWPLVASGSATFEIDEMSHSLQTLNQRLHWQSSIMLQILWTKTDKKCFAVIVRAACGFNESFGHKGFINKATSELCRDEHSWIYAGLCPILFHILLLYIHLHFSNQLIFVYSLFNDHQQAVKPS